jgi:leader peptidase (prepilin peptidase)/N-methyltransferase
MNSFSLISSPEFLHYAILFAGLFGACVGSFLTLATYRLPRDEPIGMTRSQCPNCRRTLRVMDLLPIISWVLMRGRCRYCKTAIHMRYPLIELACALGTAWMVWKFGVTVEALALAGLWWCFVAIVITDLEHTIILDEVQIAAGLFGILYAVALQRDAGEVASAALLGLGIGLTLKYGFLYLRNKDGLGLGDVKFLLVAGIWLGSTVAFVPFLFFSGVLGIITGLGWRALGLGERFPFGPALAAALLLCVLASRQVDDFWRLGAWMHG